MRQILNFTVRVTIRNGDVLLSPAIYGVERSFSWGANPRELRGECNLYNVAADAR